jgi:uncharacterized protein involved in exopolysaccharide biosynthesis/Mrp family chromosome partitioning ATPase
MFETPRQSESAFAVSAAEPPAAPPAQIDFAKIFSTLWRGRTTILMTTVAVLLLAGLAVVVAPHRYTAVTEILIDPADLHGIANAPTPSTQASDTALLVIDSQVRVLTSDDVLRRVVESQGLAHDPEFAGKPSLLHTLASRALALFGIHRTPAAVSPSLAALVNLKRDVHVTRDERTYVVDVAVSCKEPAKAARLANAIAQAYLDEQTQVRADDARQISQALTARLSDLKNNVQQAEERVQDYEVSHNIVGANGQLVNEQQLSDLNAQLAAARARTVQAKARLDEIEAVQRSKTDIGAFPSAVQSPTITALRSQYAEIMRIEAQQMTSLGDRHPAVIEIQAQAARLRRMIDDEVNRIALAARAEYQSAKAGEDQLRRSVDALKQNALATNADLITLRQLQRNVQASRTVYEAFLIRARETGAQERVDTKNIQVISRADLPLKRSSPPSNTLVALAAICLGIAAGSGLVMLRESFPGLARRPANTSRRPWLRFGLARPASPQAGRRWFRVGGKKGPVAAAADADVPVLAQVPAVDSSAGIETADDPSSRFAMGIRKVYEAVRVRHKKRANPSVLIVTADDRNDTAAVALALAALAAATERVLLIDADIERGTLAAIDAADSEAGLVDVAIGRRRLAEAIVRDRDTNISLIPFVSPNSRRDRDVKDEDIRDAFAQTKDFGMVIVAAMDLSRDPSARFFAGLVDHIVLVTKAGRAGNDNVREFISELGLDARKIRGTVLTDAKAA